MDVDSKDVPAALVEYDFLNNCFFFEEVLKRAVAKVGWLRGESVVDGPVQIVFFDEFSGNILLGND